MVPWFIINQIWTDTNTINNKNESQAVHFIQTSSSALINSGAGSMGAVGAGAPPQKMYYVINYHVITL